MDLTVENIEKALLQFYSDVTCQKEAHEWLSRAQESTAAWVFSWQLLDQHKRPEVQFFGANCLCIKISRYWNEVPEEEVGRLRCRLFEEIANFSAGPKMILTRLCVALSAFALQTMPEMWPSAVHSTINTFQEVAGPDWTSSQEVLVVLLEVLQVLPEEFLTARTSPKRRAALRQELEKGVPEVLSLLKNVMAPSSGIIVNTKALHCLSSWLQFGLPLVEAESLVIHVFQAVNEETTFETSVDALINVFCHPDAHRNEDIMQKYLLALLSVEAKLQTAIQDADMEVCQGLTKLVTAAVENNVKVVLAWTVGTVEQKDNAKRLITMALQCVSVPGQYPVDETSSDITFSIWYQLQDCIVTCDMDQYAVFIQAYTPVYVSLLQTFLVKVQFPADADTGSWSSDDLDQHKYYRQAVAETMMYVYNILKEGLLDRLLGLLGSLIDKPADQVHWQQLEAILFMFSSVSESVDLDECTYLPALFSYLPRVHFTNIQLVSQAQSLIASYADWICEHPETLQGVIPLMLEGLKHKSIAASAIGALTEVTRESQEHMKLHVDTILSAVQEALASNVLKSQDMARIMTPVGYVLSVLPIDEIMKYLNILLAPHVQQLQHLVNMEVSEGAKFLMMEKVNMLTWLFGPLDLRRQLSGQGSGDGSASVPEQQPQPVLLVLQQVLPILYTLLQKWIMDAAIIETVCDMLRKAVGTLLDNLGPVANDVAQLVVHMYTAKPQAAILDLSKQLIVLLGGESRNQTVAAAIFQSICTTTLNLYDTGIRDHPDLVESFMVLLSQMVKKNPVLLMDSSSNLLALYQAGMYGMSLPEYLPAKASCSFLSGFIALGSGNLTIKSMTEKHGLMLLQKIMLILGGESSEEVISSVTPILLSLSKIHFEPLHKWFGDIVSQEGFPTHRATRDSKEQFARKVLRPHVKRRQLESIVNDFSLTFRGLSDTGDSIDVEVS